MDDGRLNRRTKSESDGAKGRWTEGVKEINEERDLSFQENERRTRNGSVWKVIVYGESRHTAGG